MGDARPRGGVAPAAQATPAGRDSGRPAGADPRPGLGQGRWPLGGTRRICPACAAKPKPGVVPAVVRGARPPARGAARDLGAGPASAARRPPNQPPVALLARLHASRSGRWAEPVVRHAKLLLGELGSARRAPVPPGADHPSAIAVGIAPNV